MKVKKSSRLDWNWSWVGIWLLLIWGRFPAWCPGSYWSTGLQFWVLGIGYWKNCKTSVWTNRGNSACYLTLGSMPPLRRCDQEDGWLRTRVNSWEMILAYLFLLQPRGQALKRHSSHTFSDKNIPCSVPFLSPSDELFLCLTVLTKMCYFWPFVLHQKYGNLTTRLNESQRKNLKSYQGACSVNLGSFMSDSSRLGAKLHKWKPRKL